MKTKDSEQISEILKGNLYNLNNQIDIPTRTLLADIKPNIIIINEKLIHYLRSNPEAIYDLSPRKFEELLADLLSDIGYEVEITPTTRDGGKDILAHLNTPHGRILCLVEAKNTAEIELLALSLFANFMAP